MKIRKEAFYKNNCSYTFVIFTGKNQSWGLVLIKLQAYKETSQVFSYEYWEIIKNTYGEHLQTAATDEPPKED